MKLRFLFCLFAFSFTGCGIRGYHFASYGPGDTGAGNVSHASDSGARVVVPNKDSTKYSTKSESSSKEKKHLIKKPYKRIK